MNKQDLSRITAQMRSTADLIDLHGLAALRRHADYESPLRAMSYDAPIVAGGGTSDPTGNRAANPSEAAKDRGRLLWGLRLLSDNATTVANLVTPRESTTTQRQSVGHCTDCQVWCDGDNSRLVVAKGSDERVCWTCRSRRDRAAAKTSEPRFDMAGTVVGQSVITGAWSQELGRDLTPAEIAERYGEAN